MEILRYEGSEAHEWQERSATDLASLRANGTNIECVLIATGTRPDGAPYAEIGYASRSSESN